MPINLDAIAATERSRFAIVGRAFATRATLAQADRTLHMHARRTSLLAKHGFTSSDAGDLQGLALRLELVTGRGRGKETSMAYLGAMRLGKAVRRRVRTIVEQTLHAARRAGVAVTSDVPEVLGATARAGADPNALADQLALLERVVVDSPLASLVVVRAGTEPGRAAREARSALHAALRDMLRREVDGAGVEIDVLDGLVVELCRAARAAGRSAAVTVGDPSIAKELELTELYAPPR